MTRGAGTRGTGRSRKIDPGILAQMVAQGATFRDVQDRFNVTRKSVLEACEREGLPHPRTSRGHGSAGAAQRSHAAPLPTHPPRMADLMATGGRYADLRAFAARWGITEARALQDWHRLRLPVTKGGRDECASYHACPRVGFARPDWGDVGPHSTRNHHIWCAKACA